eukprot:9044695-Pyramimonas_sp.AAC.1
MVQECPQTVLEGPKTPQEGPQTGPIWPQEGPKMLPRGPEEAARGLGCLGVGTGLAQRRPKSSKTAQKELFEGGIDKVDDR